MLSLAVLGDLRYYESMVDAFTSQLDESNPVPGPHAGSGGAFHFFSFLLVRF